MHLKHPHQRLSLFRKIIEDQAQIPVVEEPVIARRKESHITVTDLDDCDDEGAVL